jgi:hypothetical protein
MRSCFRSWVGPATCGPGPAGPTLPTAALHDSYGRELAGVLERVLAGDLVTDWVSVERGVVSALECWSGYTRSTRWMSGAGV